MAAASGGVFKPQPMADAAMTPASTGVATVRTRRLVGTEGRRRGTMGSSFNAG
jgi:hypothetical protein